MFDSELQCRQCSHHTNTLRQAPKDEYKQKTQSSKPLICHQIQLKEQTDYADALTGAVLAGVLAGALAGAVEDPLTTLLNPAVTILVISSFL